MKIQQCHQYIYAFTVFTNHMRFLRYFDLIGCMQRQNDQAMKIKLANIIKIIWCSPTIESVCANHIKLHAISPTEFNIALRFVPIFKKKLGNIIITFTNIHVFA